MSSALPTAPTIISACFTNSAKFCVREWQIVTVAFASSNIAAIGLPKIAERPTTTACLPAISMLFSFKIVMIPAGVAEP